MNPEEAANKLLASDEWALAGSREKRRLVARAIRRVLEDERHRNARAAEKLREKVRGLQESMLPRETN